MTAARLFLATALVAALGPLVSAVGSRASPDFGAAADSQALSLAIGGHARTVIVHVPPGYSGTTPVPLVLEMHGSGSTAGAQEKSTGMDATADSAGFIVAYPQALIPDGAGFDWNIPGVPLIGRRAVPAGAAADVSFLPSRPTAGAATAPRSSCTRSRARATSASPALTRPASAFSLRGTAGS